jgi:uncharacterized protein
MPGIAFARRCSTKGSPDRTSEVIMAAAGFDRAGPAWFWRSNGARPRRCGHGDGDTGMTEREEVLTALRAALPDLRRRWPIRSLGIFGSIARGDADADSDVDVVVEFERPIGLSAFLALEDTLRATVDRPVDLVSRAALKPHIGRHVLRDLVAL